MLFNRSRALALMERYGLDALVATSPVNVTYFSDYHCWNDRVTQDAMVAVGGGSHRLQRSCAVFPREGEPALIVPPIFAVNAADGWVEDVHAFGDTGLDTRHAIGVDGDLAAWSRRLLDAPRHATLVAALAGVLAARGLSDARLGVELQDLNPAVGAAIREALPRAAVRDASNVIRLLRMVKGPEEIARLRRAAEINEIAGMESLALARAGQPVSALAQHFRVRVAELGADLDHFAFGMRGLGIGLEPRHVLAEGDVLFVDFGCLWRRYASDGGTTLALGELSPDLRRRHAAMHASVDAGIAALRPGVASSSVRGEMLRVLREQDLTAAFPHGHGIGLDIREWPLLVDAPAARLQDECVDESSDLPLEAGMVINLESAMFVPGAGSVHVEQSFLVTAEGSEPLVPQDRAAPFHPAWSTEQPRADPDRHIT